MNCSKCSQPIQGNRWEDAISTHVYGATPDHGGFFHFECVEDPARLPAEQFQKYAVWHMCRDRQERQAFEARVNQEFEIIHRALHALPTELTVSYMAEIYDGDGGSRQSDDP